MGKQHLVIDTAKLTQTLKERAAVLGFTLSGVCPAVSSTSGARLAEWLEAGYAGQMHYLPDRRDAYEHPRHILEGVRSLVMLGISYHNVEPNRPEPEYGRISRYAWGNVDYHDVIHQRLDELGATLQTHAPEAKVRGVVDTAPLLEREYAQLAGLGWVGKNTLLLNQQAGSWFFLAALLTDLELIYDAPHEVDHCGTCRACLDACPTNAFPEPYVLDSRRCISYLTIEHRDMIPLDLRAAMGDWLFGCDVCQDVCPWNRQVPAAEETTFKPLPEHNPMELASLFLLDDESFRQRFRRTPLWRPKRRGLLRNAAILLGNRPSAVGLQALLVGIKDDEPWVRASSAWALGQHHEQAARAGLQRQWAAETDPLVHDEIEAALTRLSPGGRHPEIDGHA